MTFRFHGNTILTERCLLNARLIWQHYPQGRTCDSEDRCSSWRQPEGRLKQEKPTERDPWREALWNACRGKWAWYPWAPESDANVRLLVWDSFGSFAGIWIESSTRHVGFNRNDRKRNVWKDIQSSFVKVRSHLKCSHFKRNPLRVKKNIAQISFLSLIV